MPFEKPGYQEETRWGKYVEVGQLGEGAHGIVKLVQDVRTGTYHALKLIPRGEEVGKYAERELLHLRKLAVHENIIVLQEVFLTDEYLCLVLEYAKGGNLYGYVSNRGCRSEDDARWFFCAIMRGIEFCHHLGITNRDIKLENILLMDNTDRPPVKLCDFGFSKSHHHSVPDSKVGTVHYMAPEVVSARTGLEYNAKAADIWSCGVLLYTLVFRVYPFARPEDTQFGYQTEHIVAMRIRLGDFDIPTTFTSTNRQGAKMACRVSPDLRDLLQRMLTQDAEERITLAQILKHPWVCGAAAGFRFLRAQGLSGAGLRELAGSLGREMVGSFREKYGNSPAVRAKSLGKPSPLLQMAVCPEPTHLPGEEELLQLLREAETNPNEQGEDQLDELIQTEFLLEDDEEDSNGELLVSSGYVLAD